MGSHAWSSWRRDGLYARRASRLKQSAVEVGSLVSYVDHYLLLTSTVEFRRRSWE